MSVFSWTRQLLLSLVALHLLLLANDVVRADEVSHHYSEGEALVLWTDTVWPRDNRQETYEYFLLPYCRGSAQGSNQYHESLGEALMGIELQNSGFEIHWKQDVHNKVACVVDMDAEKSHIFAYAVNHDYQYRFFLDNLPIFGSIGFVFDPNNSTTADRIDSTPIQERSMHLFTHKDIVISFNGDQVISVDIYPGNQSAWVHPKSELEIPNEQVSFTYSITWTPTSVAFEDRFQKFLDSDFFEHSVHWYSIINSFVLVIFMVAIVMVVLMRALKKDYARYAKEEAGLLDFERELGEEYGWKLVHGDVFRTPQHLGNLSALFGTGVQLLVLVVLVAFLAAWRASHEQKASILSIGIGMYSLTSFTSGFVSGRHYARYSGRNWVRTTFLAAAIWPGAIAAILFLIHMFAVGSSSTRALSFGTIASIAAIWLFLIVPLTLVGAILGRNLSGLGSTGTLSKHANFPARVNPIPRPLPERPWYMEPLALILASGVVPFGSIFIELYFIFISFWDDKIYYVYGIFLVIFILLVAVTACVSILSTYILLNSEQHSWHWTSFYSGGSIALYVFLYAIHYFAIRTKMHGWLQVVTYFGYTGLICFGLFCMMGTVGYLAAEWFVWKIYSNIKLD